MKQILVDEYLQPNGSVDVHALREDLFDYFNTLHYMLTDTEFDEIAQHALHWIQDHLSDHSVFESSVRSKAQEISTGDHHADYYKALILRRDQLLAARDVFREYTSRLRDIFSDERDRVIESLRQFNFDEGIYLRAIEYAEARDRMLNNYENLLEGELEDVEEALELEEANLDLDSVDSGAEETKSRSSARKSESGEKKPRGKRLFHRSI